MVSILVSYWHYDRSDGNKFYPGDIVIALPEFPSNDVAIEAIRELIQSEIKKWTITARQIVIHNIIKLAP